MLTTLQKYWKKEYILIVTALICLAIYAYRKWISQSKEAQDWVSLLPTIGGLAFGLNTLIQLTKE